MNDTFYVCAKLVSQKFGKKGNDGKDPAWIIRLMKKVEGDRRSINKLEQARKRNYNDIYRKRIEQEYNIKKKGFDLVIEELKQRLQATAAKIKRYDGRVNQYQHNKLNIKINILT